MIVLMDTNDELKNQNTTSETQVEQPASEPPVISSLYKIEDVENEQTDIPVVKFTNADPVKRHKYGWLQHAFIVLGIIQIASVIVFFQIMNKAVREAELGTATMATDALLVFVVFVPLAVIAAFINLVGLPIYLFRKKVKAAMWVLGAVSIFISFIVFAFGVHVYLINAVS